MSMSLLRPTKKKNDHFFWIRQKCPYELKKNYFFKKQIKNKKKKHEIYKLKKK